MPDPVLKGHEGVHAELGGQGFKYLTAGSCGIERFTVRGDVAQEPQGIGLAAALTTFPGEAQAPRRCAVRLLEASASRHARADASLSVHPRAGR